MTNYIKRFIYVDASETTKINPLIWPFLFATFLYGLGFLLLGDWSGVSTSSLYTAMWDLHTFLPAVWGGFAAAAGALSIVATATRHLTYARFAAMFGFLVWLFAMVIYGMNGFWLVLLTVAAPNLYHWVWYYFRVKWFERMRNRGLIRDPE